MRLLALPTRTPLEETVLDPEAEMLIETDSDAYALWKALSTVVATHPLAPRPVREDTATVFLSMLDADDLGYRTRVPLTGRQPSEALLIQLVAAELPAAAALHTGGRTGHLVRFLRRRKP
ncbi:hypothetical protein [Streptomyces sp. NPDC017991]|uniref:hypothetical protein n=1 Tax=Streptomyces sp. NPDC017991 TaxID=3365026 RepID=UPI003791D460